MDMALKTVVPFAVKAHIAWIQNRLLVINIETVISRGNIGLRKTMWKRPQDKMIVTSIIAGSRLSLEQMLDVYAS
jgi:hypothetical protein